MMYQNKKNLTMAKLVEKNEDANQVKLVAADESEIEVTISTFKRWWKKVDDESVAGEQVTSEEEILEAVSFNSVDEVLANLVASGEKVYVDDAVKAVQAAGFEVDTTYIQKYLENGDNVNKNKKKKKGDKKDKNESVSKKYTESDIISVKQHLIDLAESLGYVCKVYDSVPKAIGFAINVDGRKNPKILVDAFVGLKKCRIRMKSSVLPNAIEYIPQKYGLNARLDYDYSDDSKFKEMLSWGLNSLKNEKEVA